LALRASAPLIVGLFNGFEVLIDGHFRGILFLRTASPGERIAVLAPVARWAFLCIRVRRVAIKPVRSADGAVPRPAGSRRTEAIRIKLLRFLESRSGKQQIVC
jgi:hypothetical protein